MAVLDAPVLVRVLEVAVLLEVVVVLALALVVVLVVLIEDVKEVVVLLEGGEYVKVTICVAVAPSPPQVALTVNVPPVQAAFPPGCEVYVKLPLVGLGINSAMSATVRAGFSTVTMTAVSGPGAGEMAPVISIG
jgi:hypothetical protein